MLSYLINLRLSHDLLPLIHIYVYRPESANRWVPVESASKSTVLPEGLPRPTWLPEKPVRLLVRKHRPFYRSPLRIVSPGERISSRDAEEDQRWFLHGLFG